MWIFSYKTHSKCFHLTRVSSGGGGGDPGGHFPLLMATSSCGLSLQSGPVPDFMWVLTQITQSLTTPPPMEKNIPSCRRRYVASASDYKYCCVSSVSPRM